MSDAMERLQVDYQKVAARAFIASKQRLPESREELAEWLIEFTAEMGRMLKYSHEAYMNHMNTCSVTRWIDDVKRRKWKVEKE